MRTLLESMVATGSFSLLETLLIATLGTVVGGITVIAKWFYNFLVKTNKERAEEIKSSVQVLTELKAVIEHNNYLIDKLPDRIQDKIRDALDTHHIKIAIEKIKHD